MESGGSGSGDGGRQAELEGGEKHAMEAERLIGEGKDPGGGEPQARAARLVKPHGGQDTAKTHAEALDEPAGQMRGGGLGGRGGGEPIGTDCRRHQGHRYDVSRVSHAVEHHSIIGPIDLSVKRTGHSTFIGMDRQTAPKEDASGIKYLTQL